MIIIFIVIGLLATLTALIFYYKHSNTVLKNKVESSVLEKKAITYEKNAYQERSRIEQANNSLPDDGIRERVRDKGYARPKD